MSNRADIGERSELRRDLVKVLGTLRQIAADDPLVNPIRRLALDLSRRMEQGDLPLSVIENLIQELTLDAFLARAARLKTYLGETDPQANDARLTALFEKLAGPEDAPVPFARYKAAVEKVGFGIVFTAHPTFGLKADLRGILARLASGFRADGHPLTEADVAQLERDAAAQPHRPEASIDLAFEHGQVENAIAAAQAALDRARDIAISVAAKRWPEEWTGLVPRLLTLASWVGYDLDGRTDIGWADTLEKRLSVRAMQLRRYMTELRALITGAKAAGEQQSLLTALALVESRLALAVKVAEEEADAFAINGSDRQAVKALGHVLADNDALRLTDLGEITALIEGAARDAENPEIARNLVRLKAAMACYGLATAHTHVRLNATQIHNAIRRAVGLSGEPDDPARRRGYLAKLTTMLDQVEPVSINLGSLMAERTTARRLIMASAAMMRYADATQPVRFLIAECDTPFTVLAALYFAKLFGVEDHIDISPLFETPEALERGTAVIEELLENPHYRAYVLKRGRLAIQTGFSDAGRFLGQTAAAFAVERLHMKLARLIYDRGLNQVEVLIFDTHGESMGRGGHPASLSDRYDYLSSPATQALYRELGIPMKREVSFQGGDGYTLFGTPELAYAVIARTLEHAFNPPAAKPDPFYEETDHALEFFLAIAGFNDRIMQDRDYGALIGAFGPNLLYATGSRKARRQHEVAHGIDRNHPSQMRAIPHNAVLQQMGWLANSVGGVGEAIARDRDWFTGAIGRSDRLQRAMGLVAYAFDLGRLAAMDAYCDAFNPSYWLARARSQAEAPHKEELRRLSAMLEEDETYPRMRRIVRHLIQDAIDVKDGLAAARQEAGVEFPKALTPDQGDALELLHAVRLALILRVFAMAMRIPAFSHRHDVTVEELIGKLLELDVPGAVDILMQTFPVDAEPLDLEDFGSPATYRGEEERDYRMEHRTLFRPLLEIHDLIRRISVAISHLAGAHG